MRYIFKHIKRFLAINVENILILTDLGFLD